MSDTVIKHYEFVAWLSLDTPLELLKQHGSVHLGPFAVLPRVSDPRFGSWSAVTKSWEELAGPNASPAMLKQSQQAVEISVDDVRTRLRAMGMSEKQLSSVTAETLGSMASDVGPVPKDGGSYLPFLIEFRQIYESAKTDEQKLTELRSLRTRSPAFLALWGKLEEFYPDFPRCLFYRPLLALPGVGPKIAKALYNGGYRTAEQVVSAETSHLKAVQGIGAKLAAKIKGRA